MSETLTDKAMGVLSDPPGYGAACLAAEREEREAKARYERTRDPLDLLDWEAAIRQLDDFEDGIIRKEVVI